MLLLAIGPIGLHGQKWAVVSFFGFLLALLIANSISNDGSIVVGYSTNGATVTNITNPDSLPITIMVMLSILSAFVTTAKALKLKGMR